MKFLTKSSIYTIYRNSHFISFLAGFAKTWVFFKKKPAGRFFKKPENLGFYPKKPEKSKVYLKNLQVFSG